MTQENGGIKEADGITGGIDANEQNSGGDNANAEIKKQLDEMKTQFENLRKESAGKDKKIAEFMKEKEEQTFNSQTIEEQNKALANKLKEYEQREAFRQTFKDAGLNPDDFQGIVNEKDPKEQATKLKKVLETVAKESADKALKDFKTQKLSQIGDEPKPKGNDLPSATAAIITQKKWNKYK